MRNFITKSSLTANQSFCAEVAELVDALGSGSSEGSLIGVRVPASAPIKKPAESVRYSGSSLSAASVYFFDFAPWSTFWSTLAENTFSIRSIAARRAGSLNYDRLRKSHIQKKETRLPGLWPEAGFPHDLKPIGAKLKIG